MRLGILGGSFDPVHAGHLKLAREAMSELNLSGVVLVPCRLSPLKGRPPVLSGRERLERLRRALAGRKGLSVSDCELRRRGPSYTVDTLRYFRRRHPRAALYFLAGADTARSLRRWKALPEVLKLCRFVVASRPGYRSGRLPKGALALAFDALPVSSTQLRRRFRARGRRTRT